MARLRLAGSRALPRLTLVIQSHADPRARAAALQALDGIDDARARAVALSALAAAEPPLVVAALGVLRAWAGREDGAELLDVVTAIALDTNREAAVRVAALDALSDLPPHIVQPIRAQAQVDDVAPPSDDPVEVRGWAADAGRSAAFSALHALIVRIREHERDASEEGLRQEWRTTRGAVHAALAARGSRVALYDLRESFDAAAAALPLDFLVAVTAIGDASCLEPMARAWQAAAHDTWWRERLADAASDIMHRARLSGRSAVVKRIRGKWSGFL